MNCLHPHSGPLLFAAQLLNSGCAAGTVKEYTLIILRGLPKTDLTMRTEKVVEKLHLDSATGHAPDPHSVNAFDETIQPLEDENPELWLMRHTGARPVDVSRLFADAVSVGSTTVSVTWRWTKGNRRIQHRKAIEYPLRSAPPASFKKKIQDAKRNGSRPFASVTAAKINKVLKESRSGLTSGSFRRVFSRRIRPWCHKTGTSVQAMMNHHNPTMHTAFYDFDNRIQ